MQTALPVPQVVELFGCEPTEAQFQVLLLASDLWPAERVEARDGGACGWGAGTVEVVERGESFESTAVYGSDGFLLMFSVT